MKNLVFLLSVILIVGGIYQFLPHRQSETEKREPLPKKELHYTYEPSLYKMWQEEAAIKSQQPVGVARNGTSLRNEYGGYEIAVPEEWELDDHLASSHIRLFSSVHRLDITEQNTYDSWVSPNVFMNTTIQAIQPYIVSDTTNWIGKFSVRTVDYQREKITGIDDDMNRYSYYFVQEGNHIYTFQLKTTEEQWAYKKEQVQKIVESFQTIERESIEMPETNETYAYQKGRVSIPDGKFVMGVYEEDSRDVEKLETRLDRQFGSQMFYKSINSDYDEFVEELTEMNKIPVVTFLLEEVDRDHPVIEELLAGKYDEKLDDWAAHVKRLDSNVLFRVGNEMNGEWSKWSHKYTYNDPDIYKMAYRHIVGLFKEWHVPNAEFVWNPNNVSNPYFAWNAAEMYYPGDEFVDWIGLTAYNWGKTDYQEFQYFDDLYKDLYRTTVYDHPEKPIMIAEFGSDEKGGDKSQFVRGAFKRIGTEYPRIKLAVWFNKDHGDNELRIESSKESVGAFQFGMERENVVRNAYLRKSDETK